MADAQINENHGAPTFWGSTFAQKELRQAVARRSVQQNVFGDQLLAATIKVALQHGPAPVIFLGDAMNLSCQSEYRRFGEAMQVSGATWFAAPGNHDGFYSGISQPTPNEHYHGKINFIGDSRYGRDRDIWHAVCAGDLMVKSSELHKANGYVEEYTDGLLARNSTPYLTEDGADGCHRRSWNKGPLREVRWCTEKKSIGRHPWQAFVVQRLKIAVPGKDAEVIIADSNVYNNEPCLVGLQCSDAGLVGGFGKEQRQILQKWVADARKEQIPYVLMMHHPVDSLKDDPADQKWLNIIKSKGLSLIVSAHTHNGCVRAPFGRKVGFPLELNIGSIIDSPASFTELSFSYGQSFLKISYKTKDINPDLFGFTDASECSASDADLESISRQSQRSDMGPYTAQLIQIEAELGLVRSTMSSSGLLQNYQPEMDKQIDTVKAAIETADERCGHWWQFTASKRLRCEQCTQVRVARKPVKSTHEYLNKRLSFTIRQVAMNAQKYLLKVERSAEWIGLLNNVGNRNLAACQAAYAAKTYWVRLTGSALRQPERQCVAGSTTVLYP